MSAYTTDFAAMGLPDHSPWDILKQHRNAPLEYKTPAKRGPKKQGRPIQLAGSFAMRVNAVSNIAYSRARK